MQAARPTEPHAAPTPTSTAASTVFGAVYEVTIPRPSPIPHETPPEPLDLTKPENRDVTPPVLIHKVEPQVPEAARRSPGEVFIGGVITERGEVISLRVLRSNAESSVNEAALRAVGQWRYEPARRQGRAVSVLVTIRTTVRPH